jgi:hypothetical protein
MVRPGSTVQLRALLDEQLIGQCNETAEPTARKKKATGAGKIAPAVVLSGANLGPFEVEDDLQLNAVPSEFTAQRGTYIRE